MTTEPAVGGPPRAAAGRGSRDLGAWADTMVGGNPYFRLENGKKNGASRFFCEYGETGDDDAGRQDFLERHLADLSPRYPLRPNITIVDSEDDP